MTTNKDGNEANKIEFEDDIQLCLLPSQNNQVDYSTISSTAKDHSLIINESTSVFSLWNGLFFMFLSCIFKSIFSILTKLAFKDKSDLSSYRLLSYRTYFMFGISMIIAALLPKKVFSESFVKKEKIPHIILRTLFAIISMSLVVYTIKHMHVSDVYSVYYVYPGIILLLSVCLLPQEKFKCLDYFCLMACFFGALCIMKPAFLFHQEFSSSKSFYFSLVFLAAFLKAVEDILVRNVGHDAHPVVVPFMYSIFGIFLFPIPMWLFDTKQPTFTIFEVLLIFLIGLTTYLYQFFMALGLQNESAGRVSMMNYAQVALMYISDLLIFDKSLQFLDLFGTLLIFGFNFINGVLKTVKRFRELEASKKK